MSKATKYDQAKNEHPKSTWLRYGVELFDKMSTPELEDYARSGKLPGWFPVTPIPVATPGDGQEQKSDV